MWDERNISKQIRVQKWFDPTVARKGGFSMLKSLKGLGIKEAGLGRYMHD